MTKTIDAKKKNKGMSILWTVLVIIVILIMVAIFAYRFNTTTTEEPKIVAPIDGNFETTDILSSDFLSDGRTSLDVSTHGAVLGMTFDEIREILGEPDTLVNANITADGTANWGYYTSTFGINNGENNLNSSNNYEEDPKLAIVLHFENNLLMKINIYKPGSSLISNRDIFAMQADEFMKIMGAPQINSDLAVLELRKFFYTKKGVEFYFKRAKYLKTITLRYPL